MLFNGFNISYNILMRLVFSSTYFRSLVLLITLIISSGIGTTAQTLHVNEIGTPLVKNYLPKDYKAFSQNWIVVQDKRGILYFANGDGVLEFDGVHWNTIKIANNFTVSSLAIDRYNKIYVGSSSEFGYLAPSKDGSLKYVSLINRFDEKDRKFNYILNLFIVRDAVYFTTSDKMFRWQDGRLRFWNLRKPCNCIKFDNNIFVWQKNSGLRILQKDTLVHFSGSDFFNNLAVFNLLPYPNKKMLVVTRDSGLFIMNNPLRTKNYKTSEITYFNTEINNFIANNELLAATQLSNSNYAFSTFRAGSAIINKDGKLLQLLNKKSGILNETHNFLGQDNQKDVWIALDNGIARADIASPLSFWSDALGLKGSVMSICRYNDILYAGTWQGIYYLNRAIDRDATEDNIYSSVSRFVPLKGIQSQAWDLFEVKNAKNTQKNLLLAATSNGIYTIDSKNTLKLIAKATGIKILRSKNDPSKIYIGLSDGLLRISVKYTGDELLLVSEGRIGDLDEKIVSLTEDGKGRVWITTEFNGVFMVEPMGSSTKAKLSINKNIAEKIVHFDTVSGLPSGFISSYNIGKNIVFTTYEGVYIPEEAIKNGKSQQIKFVKKNYLGYGSIDKFMNINNLIEDKSGNLWIQLAHKETSRKMVIVALRDKNNNFKISAIPFKPIPQTEMYSIYPEKDNITWFGGDDGIIRYDGNINFEYNKEYYAMIRKVTLNADSILFNGNFYETINDSLEYEGLSVIQPEDMKEEIAFRLNSIAFDYAAPSYYDETSNLYKVFLEGFDDDWSDWSSITKKEYTNLPPGTYKFHVKAKNIFDYESLESLYEFEIRPPWYRSWFAYCIYILIVGFLVYSIVKYSNMRLREAKIRLEEVVKERTEEIIKQKKEIEREKEKAEKLLLNILPFKIAEELKMFGYAKTKTFEMTSVMFSDFKDFTIIAQKLGPQELIEQLNKCFMFFDDVCVRHNIEKIKTVGDSYMCAGGVPIRNKTNPVDIVLAAFEIRDFINKIKKEQSEKGEMLWKVRIGINTGPVISGVVGKKKFAYDIWGDTVNTASRMEQASMPNKINVSENTYFCVMDFFEFTYRGKIPVKHKGDIDMYFVERIKPELSVDPEGTIPNQKFWELYENINKL